MMPATEDFRAYHARRTLNELDRTDLDSLSDMDLARWLGRLRYHVEKLTETTPVSPLEAWAEVVETVARGSFEDGMRHAQRMAAVEDGKR